MASLIAACAAFVGSHFLLSHPFRGPLAGWLGERAFLALYTLISLGFFLWMLIAFREASPGQAPLWVAPPWGWALGELAMLFAAILLVGSLIRNPALPEARIKDWAPRGVFAITRHPMMWSFAIWAFVHGALMPTPADLVLSGSIAFLALVGAAAQDRKKAALMGAKWRGWVDRTSFVPFLKGPLPAVWPGVTPVAGGLLLWLLATWAHPLPIGIWR